MKTSIRLAFVGRMFLPLFLGFWAGSIHAQESGDAASASRGMVPDTAMLRSPFSKADRLAFRQPHRIFYPETWFHFLNGSIRREGITRDLEAIAQTGIKGVQFFHGQVGDPADWPGTEEHVECLSPKWEELVRHTAEQAKRLGLNFSLQTCPGWAMSGGPWIKPEQAMRHLSYTRTDVQGGQQVDVVLPINQEKEWQDWQDIVVLAFPAPDGDTGTYCQIEQVEAQEHQQEWQKLLSGEEKSAFTLPPSSLQNPHRIRVKMKNSARVRTIEFNPIDRFNHEFGAQPGIHLRVLTAAGKLLLDTDFPRANWQDIYQTMSFALPNLEANGDYVLEIANLHPMHISSLRFTTAARGHNWEMEGGWTLRSLLPLPKDMHEDGSGFLRRTDIINLSEKLSPDGHLRWNAPEGKWIVLRIGHVNTGRRNGPAPEEATGWEVNKLDTAFVGFQFRSYIGRLVDGPLHGLVDNMLMDSWECSSQTWTRFMPREFEERQGYSLTDWLPALFGWIIDGREQTSRFLSDWRRTINQLFSDNFYGYMTRLAHEKGMSVSYETAAGDIFPADPMEYYKWADVPMCEFWQPFGHWLSNHNYKPIRPTASAARLYGKPRVSAEAFTSFDLTWDERLRDLREVANQNMAEGVTHTVFHTYTHNPDADRYFPGTSFGGGIGTPFLRKQTWWPFMKSFCTYLARCSFMLERGLPVSSVLWYIGDEIEQKPDQYAPFPAGYAFDYCNTDALLHRIRVNDGRWMTPEGIRYDVLWLPETRRLMPETVQRLQVMKAQGGCIIRDVPLSGLEQKLAEMGIEPDVKPTELRWLHRRTHGADWYMVCPQQEKGFSGEVTFRQTGRAELWNPMNGSVRAADAQRDGRYTNVRLDLERGEMLFLVFRHDARPERRKKTEEGEAIPLTNWTLTFPEGWGIDSQMQLSELKAWKDLPLGTEGKAFSGTATYQTSFVSSRGKGSRGCLLRLGQVEEIAVVKVNGMVVDTLWAAPYETDIAPYIRRGSNDITIDVTSTWFNRLVYDAQQPKENRRTWVINGPSDKAELRPSGLLGDCEIRWRKE